MYHHLGSRHSAYGVFSTRTFACQSTRLSALIVRMGVMTATAHARCLSSVYRGTRSSSCSYTTQALVQQSVAYSTQSPSLQLTLALIKPTVCAYQPDVSAVLKEIKKSGLNVARSKRLFWTSADAHNFYAEHRGKFYYDRLILGMTSGPSLALALYGPQAITRWRAMLGPTKAYKAKYENPSCLRARYGLGDTRNGFHGSDSPSSSQRELGLIFEGWDSQWWIEREQGLLGSQAKPTLDQL